MNIEGRVELQGREPSVIHFTDSGVRKVQLCLSHGRFALYAEVSDVGALIEALEEARAWVDSGESIDPLMPAVACPRSDPHKGHVWAAEGRGEVRCPGWKGGRA